ncbi:MAG: polysaccharide pyruvyl transferase family protein [Candidatus Bathyarchaeia archaeon]
MKPRAIIVEGYYGCGSIGDEAILQGLLKNIRETFGQVEITVLSHDPQNTRMTHHVVAVGKSVKEFILNIPRLIRRSDCYIFGGGNLLHDKAFYTMPLFVSRVLIVRMFRKKFVILAQGIGPINTKLGKMLLKIGLKMADAITVRDTISSNYLSQIGIAHVLTADTSFAIDLIDCVDPDNMSNYNNLTIGVALRSPMCFEFNKPQNFENVIAETLDYLIDKLKANIIFISLLKSKSIYDDDALINSVFTKMKNQQNVKIISNITSPTQLIAIFTKFDILIGTPLHSLIFSTIAKTPFIAINYHPKIEGYIHLIGYNKEFLLNANQLNAITLIKKVELILRDKHCIKQYLSDFSVTLRRKAYLNAKILQKILESHSNRQ